jgi:hypothetical protein
MSLFLAARGLGLRRIGFFWRLSFVLSVWLACYWFNLLFIFLAAALALSF